jgi:hypothetical protein
VCGVQLDAYGDKNPHMFKDKPQVRDACKPAAHPAEVWHLCDIGPKSHVHRLLRDCVVVQSSGHYRRSKRRCTPSHRFTKRCAGGQPACAGGRARRAAGPQRAVHELAPRPAARRPGAHP